MVLRSEKELGIQEMKVGTGADLDNSGENLFSSFEVPERALRLLLLGKYGTKELYWQLGTHGLSQAKLSIHRVMAVALA